MKDILRYLEANGRADAAEIASALGREVHEVETVLRQCEKEKIILGYKAVIDWDRTGIDITAATIAIKIQPQRGDGFERVGERICAYDEVESVTLMSGGEFDYLVRIEGKSLKEVAMFVAEKLAPLDCVTATATHFELKKFKDSGVSLNKPHGDQERLTRL